MINNRVDKTSINPLSLESAVLRYVTSRNLPPLTLALLALFICTALTFTACPAEESPEPEETYDTYTMMQIMFTSSTQFTTAFSRTPSPTAVKAQAITGYTRAELEAKFASGSVGNTGEKYSDIESYFDWVESKGEITASEKNQMLSELASNGATAITTTSGSSLYSVAVYGYFRD